MQLFGHNVNELLFFVMIKFHLDVMKNKVRAALQRQNDKRESRYNMIMYNFALSNRQDLFLHTVGCINP